MASDGSLTGFLSRWQNFKAPSVSGFDLLFELALDLKWSWSHAADRIWEQVDGELWALTHNPWIVLQTISEDRLKALLARSDFQEDLKKLVAEKEQLAATPTWFAQKYPQAQLTTIAYFSMEFMLSEALPIYVGGLGNVAGDQLKAASDLGIPVVGVGLLYQQGYFRQLIDRSGAQQALFPYNDPGQLPIMPLRQQNGEWLRIKIDLPGYPIWLRAWEAKVGRVSLYLLDSNDSANLPQHRGITCELYGGGPELRILQEMILGIGGWRLLTALGITPEVCHLNEGHAAFVVLERALYFMKKTGQPFEVALIATRPGTIFTTHTAVAAGFDLFSPALMEQYLGAYCQQLGISVYQLLALGRKNSQDASEYFNMAYLGIRGSGAVNGVSQLHGKVSRHLFAPLFPRWPVPEVPVGHVTNGVHTPTWDGEPADELWTRCCGKDRWRGDMEDLQQKICCVPPEPLWQMRTACRTSLVQFIRSRVARQRAAAGETPESIEKAKTVFDPAVLTIGFARRFVSYKRPTLLLRDPDRLVHLLTHPQRPAQLVIGGKAPPFDGEGNGLIQQWTQFARRPEVEGHVVFLSDYDMGITEQMVQGVDVWINTPRRPWEACGTSGMKVLVNGGLNLSEMDGWWAEAYRPEIGWALGDGKEHDGDLYWDEVEAEALYRLLEEEITPEFYNRSAEGIPVQWIERMRKSMSTLTLQYSANRTIREYTESWYLPAAKACQQRTARKGEKASQLLHWLKELDQKWPSVHFGALQVSTEGEQHVFEVHVYTDDLPEEALRVELYAEPLEEGRPFCQLMECVQQPVNQASSHVYRTRVPSFRPASDFTPRVVPVHPGISLPMESQHILWFR